MKALSILLLLGYVLLAPVCFLGIAAMPSHAMNVDMCCMMPAHDMDGGMMDPIDTITMHSDMYASYLGLASGASATLLSVAIVFYVLASFAVISLVSRILVKQIFLRRREYLRHRSSFRESLRVWLSRTVLSPTFA